MKDKLKLPIAVSTAVGILLAAAPAGAQMTPGSGAPGVYFGAGAGVADFEDNVELEDLGDVELDDDSTAYKFFGGYRATPNFGIEGGYRSFGEADAGPFSIETTGLDVSAIGFLPLGPVDLFAKGGVIFWDTDGEGGIPGADGEDPSTPWHNYAHVQSASKVPMQGALRREWPALSKKRNAAVVLWRRSLRAGRKSPSPALRSLELARPVLRSRALAMSFSDPAERVRNYAKGYLATGLAGN